VSIWSLQKADQDKRFTSTELNHKKELIRENSITRKNPFRSKHLEQPALIETLDLDFQRSHFVSCHLIRSGTTAALVDVGAARNASQICAALAQRNIEKAQVKYVFVTHIHLDHAGGAGLLLKDHFPNAKLVVHPLGAAHMVTPAKLEAGARAVYGDAVFDAVYGALIPVPKEKILIADENLFLSELESSSQPSKSLSSSNSHFDQQHSPSKNWQIIDSPGHARHHYCLLGARERAIFTGDTFGLSYPELIHNGIPFLFPTTTPTAFEPEKLKASIDKIAASGADKAYLTHFGCLQDPKKWASTLKDRVDALVRLTQSVATFEFSTSQRRTKLHKLIANWVDEELREHGVTEPERRALLDFDIELNTQGLLVWLEKNLPTEKPPNGP
jgi:glyoxylase-like metal-dependent hydrolase (beta-lactamase superfamily II)